MPNERVKITFLGTGTSQGVPVIGCRCEVCLSPDSHDKRLRCSAMVEIGDVRLVIDAGPDFRYQMLREGVDRVSGILITHAHKDHIGGLDDVRALNYIQHGALNIYASRETQVVIKKDFDYAFVTEEKYPGAPEIILKTISASDNFEVEGVGVTAVEGAHFRMKVLGFRIGNLAYLTDFKSIAQKELDKIKNVDTLVINALQKEQHISHFTLDEAIDLSRRIGARRTYFTHVSHQMGLYKEVSRTLPEGMHLAYDGLSVEIE